MLKGLHFLLTYQCLYECDHCFLYCGPHMEGTFTIEQVEKAIVQGIEAGIESIYIEGGEPFLYYPVMLETLRLARKLNLKTGIVTNCYWANSERDAELWLKPLVEIGIDDLSVSNDEFHSDDPKHSPAQTAFEVAKKLGMPSGSICIDKPIVLPKDKGRKGEPVIGGDVVFKGRAVEKLIGDLPRRKFDCFTECSQEELANPGRVHLDPFGEVQVCQGLSVGNIWKTPLAKIMADYEPEKHPIIGPLLKGGPAELAREFGLPEGDSYVSECHLCYLIRKKLIDKFPEYLCPNQVYGINK
ncbi:MAG: radical SAM protein [candidate division Zixibacteria bacterium]|nr:radical SAM protein [candidate division Zixibacteria bacterium]